MIGVYMNNFFKLIILILIPFSEVYAQTESTTIDSGNTSWLLISSALVFLMTPGLAFFYGGLVKKKNVVSTLMQNYAALAVVGLLWVGVGYSLVFTEGNGFIGGLKNVMLCGLTNEIYPGINVPYYAFVAFQMMFAIITPALITGAIAERVRFKPWLFVMGLWSLLVYIPVAHWVWGPKGWYAELGGIDFAGGLVVHITAGFSALTAAMLYGKRNKSVAAASDIPMVMLGAGLLWFGWLGFNAGSALTSGTTAAHAFMTTFIGAATALLTWMIMDSIKIGKPTGAGASIGIVVGLICVTPGAGYVSVASAMIMCATAGVICHLSIGFIKKLTCLDDALDVFACHGVGAIVGSILTGVFASKAVNGALSAEGILISGEKKLFLANITGVGAVALYSVILTFIIIKVVNIFSPIRANILEEDAGLDVSMHGEKAEHNEI
jgi:Amt family ammonium transporter